MKKVNSVINFLSVYEAYNNGSSNIRIIVTDIFAYPKKKNTSNQVTAPCYFTKYVQ